MYCVLYIWYICILFSVKEYFIFKYIKCFLNSSVSLPRKRHTQGVYKLETILKWEDYIKKNCLFLGELTIKRHSYLGEFVPSLIQYCKKCFWNKRIFCRNLGKLTCISHVLCAGRRHCGFPSFTWTILLLKSSIPMYGMVSSLSSPEVLWGSLLIDIGDFQVSLGLHMMANY